TEPENRGSAWGRLNGLPLRRVSPHRRESMMTPKYRTAIAAYVAAGRHLRGGRDGAALTAEGGRAAQQHPHDLVLADRHKAADLQTESVRMVTAVRLGALALGFSCAGLGAFGAYEFAHRLEGGVTYLVLAAPLIAVSAAFIPPIAELTWRRGHFLKAV